MSSSPSGRESAEPRVLVVGAGAVGQSYGHCLARGGAELTFLVKPKHAAEAARGFSVYPLNRPAARRGEPQRLAGFGVLTSPEEVAARAAQAPWDAVWLCVSATALRGPWLGPLLAATGDATVVLLTPGLEDREHVLGAMEEAAVPRARAAARLVQGVITLLAFHAPLEGEAAGADALGARAPGIAYWFPPRAKLPLAGESARVGALVAALRRGGCRARRDPGAARAGAMASALMMPYLAALEAAGWRFAAVRRSPDLVTAGRAGREALAVVAAETGARAPWSARLARPWVVRLVSRLANLFIPFDIEVFLRVHFTKVGDQTRFMLGRYAALASARGLPHAHLDALRARMDGLPPDA